MSVVTRQTSLAPMSWPIKTEGITLKWKDDRRACGGADSSEMRTVVVEAGICGTGLVAEFGSMEASLPKPFDFGYSKG